MGRMLRDLFVPVASLVAKHVVGQIVLRMKAEGSSDDAEHSKASDSITMVKDGESGEWRLPLVK